MKGLGELAKAEAALREALALRARHLGPDDRENIESTLDLGRLLGDKGDIPPALALIRTAQAAMRRTGRPETEYLTARFYEAAALTVALDPSAEAIFKEVIAGRDRLLTPNHRDSVFARMGYLALLLDDHRELKAVRLFETVLEGLRAQPEGQFARAADLMASFQAAVVSRMTAAKLPIESLAARQLASAEKRLQKCLADGRAFLPDDHVILNFVRYEIAIAQDSLGKPDDAEKTYQALFASLRGTVGLAHPRALVAVEAYAKRSEDRPDREAPARKLLQEVDRANIERFGKENRWRALLLLSEIRFEANHGHPARAVELARELLALEDKGLLIRNRLSAVYTFWAAKALGKNGALPEAKEVAKRLFAVTGTMVPPVYGENSLEMVIYLRDHGDALFQMGDRAEGADMLRRAEAAAERIPKLMTNNEFEANLLAYYRGRVALAAGQYAAAEKHFTRALGLSRRLPDTKLQDRIDDAKGLAEALVAQGQFDRAGTVLDDAARWAAALMNVHGPSEAARVDRLRATVRLAAGDRAGYWAAVDKMIARFGGSTDVNVQAHVAATAGLTDDAGPMWNSAATARALVPPLSAVGHRARALALLRAEDTPGAEAELAAAAVKNHAAPIDDVIRGLAAVRRGDAIAARACAERAAAGMKARAPSAADPYAYANAPWIDRLTADALLVELRTELAKR